MPVFTKVPIIVAKTANAAKPRQIGPILSAVKHGSSSSVPALASVIINVVVDSTASNSERVVCNAKLQKDKLKI